jgi:hypothetical protein
MKRIFSITMSMALSFLLACGALGIGFYHLEIARAEEAIATFNAAQADRIYARLEKTLEIGRRIPWMFEGMHEDLQVRRRRVSYLRQDYAAILEDTDATEENEKTLSPSLRFIRANARYRITVDEHNREKVIRGLGQSIGDYARTVEADSMFSDAAFNYEFLLMLRNDIAGGKRPAHLKQKGAQGAQSDQQKSIYGEQGAEPASKVQQKMKVLVPKEGDEDPQKRGPEPGKGSALKKRG